MNGPNAIGAGSQDGAAVREPGSSSLEYFQNVVTQPTGQFEVAKCGCDCWYCEDCCERKGYNLRAGLIPALEKFRNIMMLTLTVDPELFESPRDAYEHIMDERGIGILIRRLSAGGHLHSKRFFYVVEFQKDTEFPHFHVLIDASFVPKNEVEEIWGRLRPTEAGPVDPGRPAFGITRFSVRHFEDGPLHAARYATKYLVKMPQNGFPHWVMQMGGDRRVPRYGVSRPFWDRERKPSTPTGKTRELANLSYEKKTETCGAFCNVFEEVEMVNLESGEVQSQLKWAARVVLDFGILEHFMTEKDPSKRRINVTATSANACIEAFRRVTGQSLEVIAMRGSAA